MCRWMFSLLRTQKWKCVATRRCSLRCEKAIGDIGANADQILPFSRRKLEGCATFRELVAHYGNPHSAFLRGTRPHNCSSGTITFRSTAAGHLVLLFCTTAAVLSDEKKMAGFDLVWHRCRRDRRSGRVLYSRCHSCVAGRG